MTAWQRSRYAARNHIPKLSMARFDPVFSYLSNSTVGAEQKSHARTHQKRCAELASSSARLENSRRFAPMQDVTAIARRRRVKAEQSKLSRCGHEESGILPRTMSQLRRYDPARRLGGRRLRGSPPSCDLHK